jgi:hypothetical protein
METDKADDLGLRDGIVRWCDPALVAALQQAEARAVAIGPPPPRPSWFGGASRDTIDAWSDARSHEDQIRGAATQAWKKVLADLQGRLESRELILTGVQARPTRSVDRRALPGEWAADFRFKVNEGAVEFDDQRYVAVRLALPGSSGAAEVQLPQTPIDVEQLDDETILRLLHENVERAARGPDAQLLLPGKLSLLPIIKRKMQARAEAGELLPFLKEECNWLEGWIKEKAPNIHTPTVKTLINAMAETYRSLKSRSTPRIQ